MDWISGACEPRPEPASGLHADDLPLYLIERAVLTALKHMEKAEATLVDCAGALPATKTEQAVLEARAGALAEALRTMRDYIARLVGRERAMRDDSQADDGPGRCPSAGLCGDGTGETAVPRSPNVAPSSVAPGNGDAVTGRAVGQSEGEPAVSHNVAPAPGDGDTVAGPYEDEPVTSRQDSMNPMRSWPGVQLWAARYGVEGTGAGERGGGTKSDGYPAGKLRAYGFGPVPGVVGGAG